MRLNSHLAFDGRCEAAFRFYERVLGARIVMLMRYGDTPVAQETPSDWRTKVIHGTLAIGENVLTGADVPRDSYRQPQGIWVLLNVDSTTEADRIFEALAENGTTHLAIQE